MLNEDTPFTQLLCFIGPCLFLSIFTHFRSKHFWVKTLNTHQTILYPKVLKAVLGKNYSS